jgi:Tfp pilus assembly protein PilE
MLDFVLTAGIAYGISYWVSSTGLAYWRPIVGFMLAFFAAFLVVIGLAASGTDGTNSLRFMGTGFWYALGGAGFGVYRARYKLRTGQNAPALKFPKWIAFSALGLFIIGIVAAVALPAYQDYVGRKPSVEAMPWEQQYQGQSQTIEKRSRIDEFLSDAPTTQQNAARANLDLSQFQTPPAKQPATQQNEARMPIQYGKDDTPVDVQPATQLNPFEATQAIADAAAPKSQSADEQEHLRRIYAAHPDADAIHDSPGFKAWVAKYPAYQRILSKGSTQEIIEMFTAYKNQR